LISPRRAARIRVPCGAPPRPLSRWHLGDETGDFPPVKLIDPLNPGAQIEHSTKVTLSAGDWEIDAFLDDNAAIQESNEDDNTASVLVSVP